MKKSKKNTNKREILKHIDFTFLTITFILFVFFYYYYYTKFEDLNNITTLFNFMPKKNYSRLDENNEKIIENNFKLDEDIKIEILKEKIERNSILFPFLFQFISFSYDNCGNNNSYLNKIFDEEINYHKINKNNICCLFIYCNNFIFIIFRGTDNFTNIKDDLDIFEKDIFLFDKNNKEKTGNLHSGFYNIYDKFEPTLIRLINSYKNNVKKVLILGHSLGGALTNIAICFLHLFQFKTPILA